jgi:HSP20 family molecular chaperone IbpA
MGTLFETMKPADRVKESVWDEAGPPSLTRMHMLRKMQRKWINNHIPLPARAPEASFAPPVDLVDSAHHLEVIASMPGLRPSSVRVELDGDTLLLEGYPSGPGGIFQRRLRVSADIDTDRVHASYRDDVLTVFMPKRSLLRSKLEVADSTVPSPQSPEVAWRTSSLNQPRTSAIRDGDGGDNGSL